MRAKHFRRRSVDAEPLRFLLLFEVRIDFRDVRSGATGGDSGLYSAPPLEEAELDWTPDLVEKLDWSELKEIKPVRSVSWPPWTEYQATRFFQKHYRVVLWRNPDLGMYSAPEESLGEFTARCIESLARERRSARAQIRDMFLHRFLESEQKCLAVLRDSDWGDEEIERKSSEVRSVFSGVREALSRCFLREEMDPLREFDVNENSLGDVETRERLESLRTEFIAQVNRLDQDVLKRAELVDVHEVSISPGEIEVHPRGFLWV